MSGARRKALKRAFIRKHGRAPGKAVWKFGRGWVAHDEMRRAKKDYRRARRGRP